MAPTRDSFAMAHVRASTTDVWGPVIWQALDTIAYSYPSSPTAEEQRNMRAFMTSVADVLPCVVCRHHFSQMLQDPKARDMYSSGEALVDAINQMHNKVNVRTGKLPVSGDSARKAFIASTYEGKPPNKTQAQNTLILASVLTGVGGLLFGVVLLLVIQLIIRKTRKGR